MILGEIQNKILEFKDFFFEKKRYAGDPGGSGRNLIAAWMLGWLGNVRPRFECLFVHANVVGVWGGRGASTQSVHQPVDRCSEH